LIRSSAEETSLYDVAMNNKEPQKSYEYVLEEQEAGEKERRV
jgi:hypothetical protein